MILDRLENARRYLALHPDFSKAFTFLRQPRLDALLLDKKIEIDAAQVYATPSKNMARPREGAKLEAHRKYIDIQYVIAGVDEMGWRSRSVCHKVDTPYDAEKDFELFSDPVDSWIAVKPGMFTIFFPGDAHAPLIGKGELHKIVIKVAVHSGPNRP